MSQGDEVSGQDQEEQNAPTLIPRSDEMWTDTHWHHLNMQHIRKVNSRTRNHTFRGFQLSPSSAEPSSSSGTRADTSRPVFQGGERSRERFMSDDHPSIAPAILVKRIGDDNKNRQYNGSW